MPNAYAYATNIEITAAYHVGIQHQHQRHIRWRIIFKHTPLRPRGAALQHTPVPP